MDSLIDKKFDNLQGPHATVHLREVLHFKNNYNRSGKKL
jgi:hypothetical protein